MSQYNDAIEEIFRLEKLNAEERKTIDELSGLVKRLADALESWQNDEHEEECPANDFGICTCDDSGLIRQAREAISE